MALHAIVNTSRLDEGLILDPGRYDPRRQTENYDGDSVTDIASVVNDRRTLSKLSSEESYVVLDTSDAEEGMILSRKSVVGQDDVGSTKKVVQPGDVIISRLRPYLRQVAYVDEGLQNQFGEETVLLCSTEFFVLRSKDTKSIAFLVPTLLSDEIQRVLDVSQEGGHHPRFKKKTLMSLPIPPDILDRREEISEKVTGCVSSARQSVQNMQSLIGHCSDIY